MSNVREVAALIFLISLVPPLLAAQTTEMPADILETTIVLSHDEARLDLLMPGDRALSIDFSDGGIWVNGSEVAAYEIGGALEGAWRELLSDATEGDFNTVWASFADASFEGADATAAASFIAAIIPRLTLQTPVPAAPRAPEAPFADPAVTVAPIVQVEPATPRESVRGGLVLVLPNLNGTSRSVRRLWPGLPNEIRRTLRAPLRLVIEAEHYRLPKGARVGESLVLVETDAVIAGTVAGDVMVADGTLRITPSARIEGDVVAIDAKLINEGGTILGTIRRIEDTHNLRVHVPVHLGLPARAPFLSNVLSGVGSLFETMAAYLIFAFIGALIVYFFRGHLEVVSDTVSYSFGQAFFAGLAAEVLFFPILLVLTVLVLTIIAIPFYILGSGLAVILGYLAVAHAAGENLTRRRFPSWAARLRRANSYYYVVNGLAVLLALFAAAAVAQMGGPFLGWANGLLTASAVILTWVAATSGLGAVVLSRAGTRRTFARPHELPALPLDTLTEEALDIKPAEAPRRSRQPEDRDEL